MKFKLLSVVFLNKNILKNESVDKFFYFIFLMIYVCFKFVIDWFLNYFKKNEVKDSFMNYKFKCFYVEFYFFDGKC